MILKRLLAAIALLLLAAPLLAATVEGRSPFRQGHWWDPTRSGHGFEILNAGGNVMLVWYTYDESGRPIWYTAQGAQGTLGTIWPLQKHRWGEGRIVESTDVGIMQLKVEHFERMRAQWQIKTAAGVWTQGTWVIEPFVQSGVVNEVDLTGHWYDPAHSGWGMTLLDQGDVFGAVVYAYDPAGQPTWVAGFDRGKGTHIQLYSTSGTCPSCPYHAISSQPAGVIVVDYRGDTEVTLRGAPNVALAPRVQIDGAKVMQLGRPASTRRHDFQLAPFASAATLRNYLIAGMSNRRFASGSDFSAAPPPTPPSTFSTTNLQEAGVDEADVVKSDGRYVYAVTPLTYTGSSTSGYIQKVRIIQTGPVAGGVDRVGEFNLFRDTATYNWDAGLFLQGGQLTSVTSGFYVGGWSATPPDTATTYVEIRDVANPADSALRWRAKLSGSLVSSRRIGDKLYLVTRFTPYIPGYYQYPWNDTIRASNAAALASASLESLLPRITVNDGTAVPLATPESIHAPQLGGNLPTTDMVTVTVIDLASARVVDTLTVLGRTEAMYMSTSNLYLASSRYNWSWTSSVPQGNIYNTDIHQIRVSEDRLRFVGSGSVEGLVGWGDKASFRFGENNGRLAVVSSLQNGWWGVNSNRVTILEPSIASPGLLKTVSWLPNAARPDPLGKPNERVYGTRFVGDKLFAVTFRQVDPLYIVDLANAADPRITGALELPGFSDYLHPLPNGLLLGFGREATSTGFFQGLHMTLFDVSGAAPRQIDKVQVGQRGSDSPLFRSHHAISSLVQPSGSTVVAFPAAVHDGAAPLNSWESYPWQYSGLLRFEVRGTTPADARLVPLHNLVTIPGTSSYTYSFDERGYGMGRSVLFRDTSIYFGNGQFWSLDNNSGSTSGPY